VVGRENAQQIPTRTHSCLLAIFFSCAAQHSEENKPQQIATDKKINTIKGWFNDLASVLSV
jgi:hypothetical protein